MKTTVGINVLALVVSAVGFLLPNGRNDVGGEPLFESRSGGERQLQL